MYIQRPLIMKYPVVVKEKSGLKKSIDQFVDMIISSGRYSFKADEDFGFSFEDFRFEIYNSELGVFHNNVSQNPKDIIDTIEDSLHSYKMTGSSLNSGTFANHLKEVVEKYEVRLKNVEVNTEFLSNGSLLVVAVSGNIDDGYNTAYTCYKKIRIW